MSYKNYFLWFRFRVNLSLGDATATGLWNNSHFQKGARERSVFLSLTLSLYLILSFSTRFYTKSFLLLSLIPSYVQPKLFQIQFISTFFFCFVVMHSRRFGTEKGKSLKKASLQKVRFQGNFTILILRSFSIKNKWQLLRKILIQFFFSFFK